MTLSPHPELAPLLEKYNVSWSDFRRQGTPPKSLPYLVEARRSIITDLHLTGMTWKRMIEVTGFSLGAIERGTKAAWNPASKRNRQVSAAKVGASRKGEKKVWLSERLKREWGEGSFDFHRGRVRTLKERETLRLASLRPEVRQKRREAAIRRFQRPVERSKRSETQTRLMLESPSKWMRGRGSWVEPTKCDRPRIWTRSSYERVVAGILDSDPTVVSYSFEPRFGLPSGRWILPDFVVTYQDGRVALLEVKASWALDPKHYHKIESRMQDASSFAASKGWDFLVWTEKDFADALHNSK